MALFTRNISVTIIAVTAGFVLGCGDSEPVKEGIKPAKKGTKPAINLTSKDTLEASLAEIEQTLSPDEYQSFSASVEVLKMTVVEPGNVETFMPKKYDGWTVSEINEAAAPIKLKRYPKQIAQMRQAIQHSEAILDMIKNRPDDYKRWRHEDRGIFEEDADALRDLTTGLVAEHEKRIHNLTEIVAFLEEELARVKNR